MPSREYPLARILPLIFAMGCSAALNPSTTVTNQAVQSGQTTVLSWTDAGTGPHHVWLNYEGNATTGVSMGPVQGRSKTSTWQTEFG